MKVRSVVGATVVGAAFVVATAAPASAHTVAGVAATDYRSIVVSITPAAPGVRIHLLDLGRRIELTNTAAVEVVVLGYQGEPYLRVGPDGVWENVRSPAVYENRPVPAGTPPPTLPAIADASAPAQWRRVSGGRTATWRDSRTSWHGARPAAVSEDPHRTVAAADWSLPFRYGDTPAAVDGRIVWVARPNPYPWLAAAAVLAVAVVAAGTSRRWGPLLAVALSLLVAVDAVRSYASAVVSGGSRWAVLARTLLAGDLGVFLWVLGALAVARLHEERESGLLLAAFVGAAIALFSGLTDIPYLLHAEVPVAAPAGVARAGVVLVTGLGVGLAVAAVLRIRGTTMPARDGVRRGSGAPTA